MQNQKLPFENPRSTTGMQSVRSNTIIVLLQLESILGSYVKATGLYNCSISLLNFGPATAGFAGPVPTPLIKACINHLTDLLNYMHAHMYTLAFCVDIIHVHWMVKHI